MIHDPPDDSPQLGLQGLQWRPSASLAGTDGRVKPIAPSGHTLAVLVVLGFLAVSGYLRAHATPPASDYLLRSLSAIVSQVLLTGAVIAGIYRRGRFFQSTLLNRRVSWQQDLAQGLLVYMGGVLIVLLPAMVAGVLHIQSPDRSLLAAMLPHAWWHMLPWLGISLCAGIGEELVFRGYLLQQGTAWLGSARWSIVLTSLLFGVMHAYEGWVAVLSLTMLAGFYAVVTVRSGHLRAAIVAHVLQDLLTALFFLWRHQPL
jgi:membrane protease YdiL (CAAX protease family)